MAYITEEEFRQAQKTIKRYEDQLEKEQLGQVIVRLRANELDARTYNPIKRFFYKKGISIPILSWNHIAKMTKEDIINCKGLGETGFNRVNDLLKSHGMKQLPFAFPK